MNKSITLVVIVVIGYLPMMKRVLKWWQLVSDFYLSCHLDAVEILKQKCH